MIRNLDRWVMSGDRCPSTLPRAETECDVATAPGHLFTQALAYAHHTKKCTFIIWEPYIRCPVKTQKEVIS